MLRRSERAVVAAAANVFGAGMGLALLGREPAAYGWLGAAWLVVLAGVLWPWLLFVAVVVAIGSAGAAFLVALRSDTPLRWQHRAPAIVLFASLFAGVGVKAFVWEAFKMPSSSMYPTLEIGDHFYIDKLTPRLGGYHRGDVIVHVYPCAPDRDYIKRIIGLPGDTVEVRCSVVYVNGKPVTSELVDAHGSYDDFDDSSDQWYPRQVSRYRETIDGHSYEVFQSPERPDLDAQPRTVVDARDFPRVGNPFPPNCKQADGAGNGPPEAQVIGELVTTRPGASACEPQLHYVVPADHVFVLGDNRGNSNDSRVWGGVPMSMIKGRVTLIWWSRHLSRLGTVR